jgi:hypothetical protein
LIRVKDGSKSYNPETHTILDIPTALTFFHSQPEQTRNLIGEKVRHLVKSWNEKYKGVGPQVKLINSFFYWLTYFLCQTGRS